MPDCNEDNPMSLPLEGIRVIELGTMIAVPAATHLLASFGAEVVKVEDVETGDPLRFYGSKKNGMSAWFANANHGKRSLAVNLKSAEGREILWRLLETADVLVEGFRDGVVDTLGFAYAAVAERKPDIVYCSSSGFGKTGPYAGQPAYDPLIQATSGWAGLQGAGGEPSLIRNMLADKVAASANAQAIMAALIRRFRTGEGAHVENSMLESNVQFIWSDGMMHCSLLDDDATQLPNMLSIYRVYGCQDGHVGLAVGTDAQWLAFCEALDRPDLAADERLSTAAVRSANMALFFDRIAAATGQFSRAEVLARLNAAGVPVAPVNQPEDVVCDPQVVETGMLEEHRHPAAGRMLRPRSPVHRMGESLDLAPAPAHGEHTAELLAELGFAADRIDKLRDAGVIR
jgi:crotonobetainyl-CoA:carnitine CoA-transferase CaiB-like acyl-CoA transferase